MCTGCRPAPGLRTEGGAHLAVSSPQHSPLSCGELTPSSVEAISLVAALVPQRVSWHFNSSCELPCIVSTRSQSRDVICILVIRYEAIYTIAVTFGVLFKETRILLQTQTGFSRWQKATLLLPSHTLSRVHWLYCIDSTEANCWFITVNLMLFSKTDTTTPSWSVPWYFGHCVAVLCTAPPEPPSSSPQLQQTGGKLEQRHPVHPYWLLCYRKPFQKNYANQKSAAHMCTRFSTTLL